MAKCLYTYVDLNEHVPADDRTATREHIVPYALGGSDAFAIRYCSKKANNDLGRDIDAPFIALPLVGFKRHSLGLKSYSGTVPDIVFKGECEELKRTCSIIFPYQKPVYADFEPEVQGGIGAGRISFAGSEDRLSHAVNSLIKKARRNGLTLLGNVGQQLELIANVDDAMRVAVRSTGETLHFQMDFGMDAFAIPWSRGLIKIALGLGAYALGESWAFSAAADNLRSCLICNANSLKDMPLLGTTVGRIAPEMRCVSAIDRQAAPPPRLTNRDLDRRTNTRHGAALTRQIPSPRPLSQASDNASLHLLHGVVRRTRRQRHECQRRIIRRAGRHARTIRHEEVGHFMRLVVPIQE
jgi:hypothetical protein